MHRKEHYSRPNLVPVVAGAVIGYPHGPQLPVSPDGAGVRAQAGRESCADDSPVEGGEYIYEIRGLARPLTSLYPFTLQM